LTTYGNRFARSFDNKKFDSIRAIVNRKNESIQRGNHMKDKKKITAAIAAVSHYMRMEEGAMLMQQAAMGGMPQAPSVSGPATAFSPWSMNGRQMQMQMRNLMQMRTFK
jgi:hypothetical protein